VIPYATPSRFYRPGACASTRFARHRLRVSLVFGLTRLLARCAAIPRRLCAVLASAGYIGSTNTHSNASTSTPLRRHFMTQLLSVSSTIPHCSLTFTRQPRFRPRWAPYGTDGWQLHAHHTNGIFPQPTSPTPLSGCYRPRSVYNGRRRLVLSPYQPLFSVRRRLSRRNDRNIVSDVVVRQYSSNLYNCLQYNRPACAESTIGVLFSFGVK
jgi:hypothetical protein